MVTNNSSKNKLTCLVRLSFYFIAALLVLWIVFYYVCGVHAIKNVARPVIGAYYYAWYGKDGQSSDYFSDIPILHNISSRNPIVIDKHIQLAKEAGIYFLIFSWTGINSWEDRTFRYYYLDRKNPMPVAIMYESAINLNGSDDIARNETIIDFDDMYNSTITKGQKFLNDMDYIADAYFNNPAYYKINNRPVIFQYIVREWRNYTSYLDVLDNRMKTKGYDLFVIADVIWWSDPSVNDWTALQKHFSGITAYNMYDYGQPDVMVNFFPAVRSKWEQYKIFAYAYKLYFVPSIMPGYNDRTLRGVSRPVLSRDDGIFYTRYWELARDFISPEFSMVSITSFNEWYEGTEIEPSVQYDSEFINLTKNFRTFA